MAIKAVSYQELIKDALTRVPEQTCEALFPRLSGQAGGDARVALLDVREQDEIASGTLPGAVHIPRGLLENHVGELFPDRTRAICVYCSSGKRSALAGDVMLRMGYESVTCLAGGIERWSHLGLPLEGGGPVCLVGGQRLSWADVRREFAIVARRVPVLGAGERPLVYLDHAATTHAPSQVMQAYSDFVSHEYANVHRGTHLLSRKATERFEEAYYVVADFLRGDLKHGCVAFTANTTQAIELAAHIMAERPGKVITTELEHHSNELPWRRRGSVLRARITDQGELDLGHMEELLRKHDVKLVAVCAGANVTGYIPDVHAIARLAHEHGAMILVDAAQALAHMPMDVKPEGSPEHLDFVAAAGHKAYAPFGLGFLYGPRAVMNEAPPWMPGGGTASRVTGNTVDFMPSPDRHQGGTPNIPGVVGLAKSLQMLQTIGLAEVRKHEMALWSKAVDGMREMGGVVLYGPQDPAKRLGVIPFNIEGVSELLTAAVLSEEGALAVRNGRFCAHIHMDKLLATQHPKSGAEPPTGAVRASIGLYNDDSDVERLLEFVRRVRDKKWVGRYRVKGDSVSAEFAGRCADRWMESSHEAERHEDLAANGYAFDVLHEDADYRSYLVYDAASKDAAIVDPVREHVDGYLELLSGKGLHLRYTIETHTHADHLSGSVRLKELTGARMVMHERAMAPCVDMPVKDGDTLRVGSVTVQVMATPGHTRDSMCLLLPDRVLTGDTLLIDSCGRTDLQQGDAKLMWQSLGRLMELPDETLVFPAHDYRGQRASTVGKERKSNKRILLGSEEAFVAEMQSLNMPLPKRIGEALPFNQECL